LSARLHAAAGVLFVCTWAIRFLALVGFPNDHYVYLAPAQQMLAGELPSRDFVDPGTPLMYAVSAAARLVVDAPLLAEALVVSTAFALAAALTMYAAFAASGSIWIAVLVAIAQVAMFPRSYHYPKLLFYAAGALAMWGYVRAPSWRRAALLAACVVLAFLFRHDHGVYLGAATLATAAAAGPGWKAGARGVVRVGALMAAFVAPYLAFVEATTGLVRHVEGGLAYSRAEAARTLTGLPRIDWSAIAAPENAVAALFYIFHALPVVALVVLAWHRTLARWLLPIVLLAVAVNVSFLRDPLEARLGDVAVPACILAAWLIAQAVSSHAAVARVLVAVVAAIALAGVAVIGQPAEQINRAALLRRPDTFVRNARERVGELLAPFARRQMPSRRIQALVPFLEYVGRCTHPGQRLFVAGEAPEIYVYARRPYAGGQQLLRAGFFSTVADQRRLVLTLREQDVPLALVLTEGDAASFALVMAELEAEFEPAGTFEIEGQDTVLVRVSRRATPRSVDTATGLPCFV
jgi:hypothetical protein